MNTVKVRVISDDQEILRDTVDLLARSTQISVAGPGADVDVFLLVADDVSVFTLRELGARTSAAWQPGKPAVVLACNRIRRLEMVYAARLGVTAVVGRDAHDYDRLVEAVIDAALRSTGVAPSRCVALTDVVPDPRSTDAPLSEREIQVLQLLAEGFDTVAIATKVNYSERTVKHIIHGFVTRKKLRNRVHAVAYALRTGVL